MTQALRHILTVNTSTCVVGLFFKVPANVRSGQYSKVQAGKRSLGRGDGGARNVSVRDVQHHRESTKCERCATFQLSHWRGSQRAIQKNNEPHTWEGVWKPALLILRT